MTTSKGISVAGLALGISGAVPERQYWTETAQDRGILEFVALLSGLVLKYGGRVVHGCHPAFTPVLLKQAENYEFPSRPLTLCMSELWAKRQMRFERRRIERLSNFIVVDQVGIGDARDPAVRNASLTAMRRTLVAEMNLLVVVGGMRHEGTGLMPGIDEEFSLAQARGLPCFVVGGLGGEAAQLAERIKQESELLKNGLTSEQNARLLSSTDITGCVRIIFEHIVRNRDAILSKSFSAPR